MEEPNEGLSPAICFAQTKLPAESNFDIKKSEGKAKGFSCFYTSLPKDDQLLVDSLCQNIYNELTKEDYEKFYKELLHIIGLEEAKEGGKNIIRRKKENRSSASLIEVTMDALQSNDPNYIITAEGTTKEERIFNVALELCITWINRILFKIYSYNDIF